MLGNKVRNALKVNQNKKKCTSSEKEKCLELNSSLATSSWNTETSIQATGSQREILKAMFHYKASLFCNSAIIIMLKKNMNKIDHQPV